MYKVQISIKNLFLRIKAPVLARNIILIDRKQLDICGSALLVSGTAEFQVISEFIVSAQFSLITLQAVLQLDETRKLGGYSQINLKSIEKNKLTQLNLPLYESPDKKAFYKLAILYEDFNSIHFNRQLTSLQDYKLNEELSELRQKNKQIQSENEILKEQITHLKDKNQRIITDQNNITHQFQTLKQSYQQQINIYNPKLQQLSEQLKNTKMQSAKIMNLLDECGELSILDSIDTIVND